MSGEVVSPEEGEVFDIELEEELLEANRRIAEENRRILDELGVKAIDVMGSIGSGKTLLIERLIELLRNRDRAAVLCGDLTTTIDMERIRRHGVKVIQINTGKECHLDANLVGKALRKLDPKGLDILFIENVGNLICPAEFPLGAHKRVVVVSVTEGAYTPLKHPYIFMDSDIAVINKIDLAQAMEVNPDEIAGYIRRVNPKVKVVKTSCKTGEGVREVAEALGILG